MVRLSSHPKRSMASLALATKPATRLIAPSARPPVRVACSAVQPKRPRTCGGNVSRCWNMRAFSPVLYLFGSPHKGAIAPQNRTAVPTPTMSAAKLPATLLPRLILGVYLPHNLPKVLAAVSHQLRSKTLTTPMSFGNHLSTIHAPRRYHMTPFQPSTSDSLINAPTTLMYSLFTLGKLCRIASSEAIGMREARR